MKVKGKVRGNIFAAIICGVVILAVVSLIIVNIFVPVKYLFAYTVTSTENEKGQMRVSFVDVGFGDSTLVEFPDGKTLLIDGGNGTYSSNVKLLRALNKRGIKNIDYLVLSSLRKERCGGLSEVISLKGVSNVFAPYFPYGYYNDSYNSFCEELDKLSITPEISEYGNGVFNDEAGYAFCFLRPSAHTIDGGESDKLLENPTAENVNNCSAALWIEYGGVGILLAGDGGEEVQSKLVAGISVGFEVNGRIIDASECKILKIPDHGSANAAYGMLYEFISPEAAIISVGDNGYGCPSVQAISSASQATNGNVYRTDEDGTVTVTVRDGAYEIQKEKK